MTTRSMKKLGRFSYEMEIKVTDKKTAYNLNKEFNLNLSCAHYNVDGTWFPKPESYPVALFDMNGYLIMQSSIDCHGGNIIITKYLNIRKGINHLNGYVRFNHSPQSIENYDNQINQNRLLKEKENKDKMEKTNKLRKILLLSLNGNSTMMCEK